MRDFQKTVVKAFPAANANNTSDPIQVGANKGTTPTAGAITCGPSDGHLEIDVPALPALVDGDVTFTIEDSADNSSWASAVGYGNLSIPGVAVTGSSRWNKRLAIHPHLRPFVRLKAAVHANGGNNTALSYTFALNI